MRQPEGFIAKGKEHLVCRLKKSIHGLHTVGILLLTVNSKKWTLSKLITTLAYTELPQGRCFSLECTLTSWETTKKSLSECFDIKDMGMVLGVKVVQNDEMNECT